MAIVNVPPGTTNLTTPTAYGADGDTLVFNEGSQTFTAADRSSASLAGIRFRRLSRVNFLPTAPLKCDVDATADSTVVNEQPSGSHYYHPAGNHTLWQRFKNLAGCFYTFIAGGKVDRIEHRSGTGIVLQDVAVDEITMDGGSLTVVERSSSNTIETARVSNGVLNIGRSISTLLRISGARSRVLVKRESAASTAPTGAAIQVFGGHLTWQGGDISGTVVVEGDGTIDLHQITQDITVAALEMTSAAYRRSKVTSPTPAGFTITYTAAPVIRCDEDDTLP